MGKLIDVVLPFQEELQSGFAVEYRLDEGHTLKLHHRIRDAEILRRIVSEINVESLLKNRGGPQIMNRGVPLIRNRGEGLKKIKLYYRIHDAEILRRIVVRNRGQLIVYEK